jgi:hypothetical protein
VKEILSDRLPEKISLVEPIIIPYTLLPYSFWELQSCMISNLPTTNNRHMRIVLRPWRGRPHVSKLLGV